MMLLGIVLCSVSVGAFILLLWPTYREHWITTIGLCAIALGAALNSMRLVDGMECATSAWGLMVGGAVLAVIGERVRTRKGGHMRALIYARHIDNVGRPQ